MLLVAYSARPVHVVFRAPEEVNGHDDARGQVLQSPRASVVTQTANRPQQQRRYDQVVKPKQSHWERSGGVEQVFGAADQVLSENQRDNQIHRIQSLKDQQSDGLPGK